MDDYEFTLEDRIAKIQAIDKEYNLQDNSYISFSGGKDSVVLSKLIDIALPNNQIPRVYFNTGIEYIDMVKFVRGLSQIDPRVIIYNSNVNIREMLKENGYPFKSKQYSHNWSVFNNCGSKEKLIELIEFLNKNPKYQNDYEFIHSLPRGMKTTIKFYFGIRERESWSLL